MKLRIHPSVRAVILIAVLAVVALAHVFLPQIDAILWGLDAAAGLLILLDLVWLLARSRRVEVSISGNHVWSCGRQEDLVVRIANRGSSFRRVTIAPDLPDSMTVVPLTQEVQLPARRQVELVFRVSASRRGSWPLQGAHVGLPSPLRLWWLHLQRGHDLTVRVYPDLRRADDYGLLARTNRLGLIGVRSDARPGGTLEFERLRPFQAGDQLGRIDWKATARRDEPTVRDYRTERNQNLVLLVDCGRMVMGEDEGRPLIDAVIDAALLLAHVALSQGDRVGLVAYAGDTCRLVPLGAGRAQFAHLIHALHDLEARPEESRHDLAFLTVARRFRQRSLVCTLTTFLDETNATILSEHLRGLVGRHLPVGVFLRQEDLFAPLAHPPADRDELLTAGVAAHIAVWRRELLERLERNHVRVIDCFGSELGGRLISTYLRLKAQRLL